MYFYFKKSKEMVDNLRHPQRDFYSTKIHKSIFFCLLALIKYIILDM